MSATTDANENDDRVKELRAKGALWRSTFSELTQAAPRQKIELKQAQEAALEVNAEEDHMEEAARPKRRLRGKRPPVASFDSEGADETPSAFIRHLISELPSNKQLNRRQTLFMVMFAEACDKAWEEDKKHRAARSARAHASAAPGRRGHRQDARGAALGVQGSGIHLAQRDARVPVNAGGGVFQRPGEEHLYRRMESADSAQRCRHARPGDGKREDAGWQQGVVSRGAVEERESPRHRRGEHGVRRRLQHARLSCNVRPHENPLGHGEQLHKTQLQFW